MGLVRMDWLPEKQKEMLDHLVHSAAQTDPGALLKLKALELAPAMAASAPSLKSRHPAEWAKQEQWLGGILTETLDNDASPWAALYLAFHFNTLVAMKVDQALHPVASKALSPFVYAMQ